MKRIVLIGMVLTAATAFAYMGPRDSMRPMLEALELTPAQKSELSAIRKESRSERLKLLDALETQRDKSRARMMAVLTEEQRAQLKELRSEMRKQRAACRCDRSGPPKRQPRCDRR